MHRTIGRWYRPLSFFDTKFDAVCEAPGGRINEAYTRRDIFRLYPRTRRRAILFHSIEAGAWRILEVRRSVASCDLVVARTAQSAKIAGQAGARWVVESADVTFLEHPRPVEDRAGIAIALRIPGRNVTSEYLQTLRTVTHRLCELEQNVDFVLVEEPFGLEMKLTGIGTYARRGTGLSTVTRCMAPFLHRRDAVISCRLHTTIIGLLHGNRKILQYHIEPGTNKIEEIVDQMGSHRLRSTAWLTLIGRELWNSCDRQQQSLSRKQIWR